MELPSPIPTECRFHYDDYGRIKSDWNFQGNVVEMNWEYRPDCLALSVENYQLWAKSRHYRTINGIDCIYPAWVALVIITPETTFGSQSGMYHAEFISAYVLPAGQWIRTAVRGLLSRYETVEFPDAN